MAILSVKEITGGRASGELESGTREYTRIFRVVTDSGVTSALAVGTADGIPALGTRYEADTEFDNTALCKRIEPQQDSENPRIWTVRVEYGSVQIQKNPDPLLRPSQISLSFNKCQRAVTRYINGAPITNSAGEPFDPPLLVDDSRPVLTFVRNEPVCNPAIAIAYQDAVNSDWFFGAAPGQAKVAGISAVSQEENGVQFWQITYEIEFRWDGWQPILLDYGRNRLTANGTWEVIKKRDANGSQMPNLEVTEPVPLNGFGQELFPITPFTIVPFPVISYRSLPFAQLALP